MKEIGESFLVNCRALESVQLPQNNGALFEQSVKAAINH